MQSDPRETEETLKFFQEAVESRETQLKEVQKKL